MGTERFGPYSIDTSNTDKMLFPGDGITKGDLIAHYRELAKVILPHAKNRPLTLHRFPDGIDEDGFYQQKAADYFPDWIDTHETPRAEGGEAVKHALANKQATLVYLADQAVITLHGWLARAPDIRHPDRLIFDLDPAGKDFDAVRKAARQVADLMEALGMTPFAMTTGSRGLHLVTPLDGKTEFDAVRDLARDMAGYLAERHDDRLTVEQRKDKRRGRLYLDVMRNAYGQTVVLPGAPVATPLDIGELSDASLDPQGWNIGNIRRRLGQKGDPWTDIQRHAVGIDRARKALEKL